MNEEFLNKKEFLQYIEGTLPAKRKAEIDVYLKNNPLEKKALEGAKSVNLDVLFSSRLDQVEKKIDQRVFDGKHKKTNDTFSLSKNTIFRKLAIACSIMLLLGIAFYASNNYRPKNEKLFVQNFDLYPDVLSEIKRTNEAPDPALVMAMNYYDQQLFKKAIEGLEHYKDNEKAMFYLAISELGMNHPKTCLSILDNIENMHPTTVLKDGIVWYRALSYIKMNEIENAVIILSKISNSEHYKRIQANAILKEFE